jgi:hypothetical protein
MTVQQQCSMVPGNVGESGGSLLALGQVLQEAQRLQDL